MKLREFFLTVVLGMSTWALAEPTVNGATVDGPALRNVSPGGSGIADLTSDAAGAEGAASAPESSVPLRSALQAEALKAAPVEADRVTGDRRDSSEASPSATGILLRYVRDNPFTVGAMLLGVILAVWLAASGIWWMRMQYETQRAVRRRKRRAKSGDAAVAATEPIKRRESRPRHSEHPSKSSRHRERERRRSGDREAGRDADSTDSGARSVRPQREPPPDASSA